MRDRNKKQEIDIPRKEYDISSMDPKLFEDPILLLDYLQDMDTQDSSTVPTMVSSDTNKKKSHRMYQHNESRFVSSERETKTEKGDIQQKVERVLFRNANGLTLYEIQDKSGVDDLDGIIEALESLRLSGKIERLWSRKNGGRSIYKVISLSSPVIESKLTKLDEGEENKNKALSNDEISDEVLRLLRLASYPMSVDTLCWKSVMLSYIDKNILQNVILNLMKQHKIYELKVGKGQTLIYASNPIELKDKPEVKNKAKKNIENEVVSQKRDTSLEAFLLKALQTRSDYSSLAELYGIEPVLSKYKRSIIISTLLDLLNRGLIERKMDLNKYGAKIWKYRIRR